MEKEKARLASLQKSRDEEAKKNREAEMERLLREEIRAELEKELGIGKKTPFSGKLGRFAVPALVVLGMGTAFMGGRSLAFSSQAQATPQETAADPGKNMIESFLKGSANMGAAMAKNGGGISMSDIVAAAQQGQSSSATGGGASGPGAGDSLLAGGTANNDGKSPGPALGREAKEMLAVELATALAEMGQIPRAKELLARAYALAGETLTVDQATRLRLAHLRIEAWSMITDPKIKLAEQVNTLEKVAAELPTAGGRAIGFATIGEVMSTAVSLEPAITEAFYHRASEEYAKETTKAIQAEAAHQLMIARGKGALNAIAKSVENGRPDSAKRYLKQLDEMSVAATHPVTSAVLLGLSTHAKLMLGNSPGALASAEAALLKAPKALSMEEEARILKTALPVPELYSAPQAQAAITAVLQRAEKWGGKELAGVLVELGQLHVQNGNTKGMDETKAKLEELTAGKPGMDDYLGQLIGMTGIVSARLARKSGAFPLSEQHLRNVAALTS